MGQISLQIPQTGQPNSTEDPKIASDLTTLQTLVNGNLDVSNMLPAAGFWSTVAWTPLTLSTNIGTSGPFAASARRVGDMIEFSGQMVNNTGGTLSSAQWATLPSFAIPTVAVLFPVATTGGVAYISVPATPGHIVVLGSVAAGSITYLDGIRYRIA